MTLIEAIKSGKPFRRKGDDEWLAVKGNMIRFARSSVEGVEPYSLCLVSHVLADDYETQEPTVTITASAFKRAADEVFPPSDFAGYHRVAKLAEKLGLSASVDCEHKNAIHREWANKSHQRNGPPFSAHCPDCGEKLGLGGE